MLYVFVEDATSHVFLRRLTVIGLAVLVRMFVVIFLPGVLIVVVIKIMYPCSMRMYKHIYMYQTMLSSQLLL